MKPKVIIDHFTIRQASLADLQQLKQLALIAYGQYAETLGAENWALMEQHLNKEAMLIDLLQKSTCFVSCHNSKIIGMAYLLPSGNPNDIYKAEWCCIRLVAVDPAYKGKSIAKTLTRMCIEQAIKNGEQTIALHTSSMMPAAMHIYERFGFKIVKELGTRYGQDYFLYTLDLPKKIETERLILRAFVATDNHGLFELNSDPEVLTYLDQEPFTTLSQSDDQIRFIQQQYAQQGIGRWAVIEKASGEFIGWSGLKYITETMNGHTGFYDVGYRLIKRYWGKGYATESAKAAIEYGFDVLHVDVIYGICDTGNVKSANALKKAGLTFVETFEMKGNTCYWFRIDKAEIQ